MFRPRSILNRFVNHIIETKQISWDKQVVINHIYQSLDAFNLVNSIFHRLGSIRDTTFSYHISEHIILLDQFWNLLKPDTIRRPYIPKVINTDVATTFMSNDWSEVGFQSMDPSSDFRGMGLLGLVQLHYFSLHRPKEAIEVLKESNHTRRFYPFAATGINISFFVYELMCERRLDTKVLHHLFTKNSSIPIINSTDQNTFSRQSSTSSSTHDGDITDTWKDSPGTASALESVTANTRLLTVTQVASSSSFITHSSNKSIMETTEEPFPIELVNIGETCIHELYCDIYIDFNSTWRERDPPNIMSFQPIFDEVKKRWRKKLPVFGC